MDSPVISMRWALWSEGMTATGSKECPNAVEDGIGVGGIADHFMPPDHRELAGDER